MKNLKQKIKMLQTALNLYNNCPEFPSEIANRFQDALIYDNFQAMQAEINNLKLWVKENGKSNIIYIA